jgi:CheY-like chemotaxis protein
MVMPRMNGLELLRRCQAQFPGLAFLLQSGYSETGATDSFPASETVGFIAKPYSIESLALRLRSLLDRPVTRPLQ